MILAGFIEKKLTYAILIYFNRHKNNLDHIVAVLFQSPGYEK